MLSESRNWGREPRADEMDRRFRVTEDVAADGQLRIIGRRRRRDRRGGCCCEGRESTIVRTTAGDHVQRARESRKSWVDGWVTGRALLRAMMLMMLMVVVVVMMMMVMLARGGTIRTRRRTRSERFGQVAQQALIRLCRHAQPQRPPQQQVSVALIRVQLETDKAARRSLVESESIHRQIEQVEGSVESAALLILLLMLGSSGGGGGGQMRVEQLK